MLRIITDQTKTIKMKLNRTIRSFLRNPLNSSVIIISLAIGMACTNLIIIFITRELNTDSFLKNSDRIYLLKCDNPFEKGSKMSTCRKGAAEYIKENFSQVEDFCRIRFARAQKVMACNRVYNNNLSIFETSANFFNIFSYTLLTNNPDEVLTTKDDIVISEELAQKYFGERLPVGRIITIINGSTKTDLTIKGIFVKPVENSQFQFDMVRLANETERIAFLLLKENADPTSLEKQFAEQKDKIPVINDGIPGSYYLERFKKTYFDTSEYSLLGNRRDKSEIWIALAIGLMIICVASVNYLGLINNKLIDKTPEFYIRSVNGGSRASIITDFLIENLIIIVISFILSLEIISWITPLFNELTGSAIKASYFISPDSILIMSIVVLFLLLATLFFSINKINKQTISSSHKVMMDKEGKIIKIPAFNIFQLIVSIVLLICSVTILRQINYITNKDIGLNKDVIEIKIPENYANQTKVFREELLKYSSVSSLSVTTASPLLEWILASFHYTDNGADKQYSPKIFRGDEAFLSTLGISLSAGRDFSGNINSDKNNCIINESLAKYFSNRNLMGEKLPGYEKLTVIGIVKDFNCSGLKDAISPGVIIFDNSGNHLLVGPSPGQSQSVMKSISETWQKLIPDFPLNVETVKDRFEWYHRSEINFAKLIGSCCLISLFLSMIGLFAISFHSSRKRTKEIGIRKINGATIREVMLLLNSDFFRWIVIAFVTGTPIAWYFMHKWLQGFAYRTELGWWIFALAGLLTVTITLLTVSWQSWRTATRNPVEALRYE
jgi:putative ABC transport system permease protein